MSIKNLGLCLGLAVAVNIVFTPFQADASTLKRTVMYTPTEVTEGINEARLTQGLTVLATSSELQAAAQAKADDMVSRNYFSHSTPQSIPFWSFILKEDYRYLSAGENLALCYDSSDSMIEGWMNSPGHKANILSGTFTETGIGIAYGTYQDYRCGYVVQMFGTPVPENMQVATVSFN